MRHLLATVLLVALASAASAAQPAAWSTSVAAVRQQGQLPSAATSTWLPLPSAGAAGIHAHDAAAGPGDSIGRHLLASGDGGGGVRYRAQQAATAAVASAAQSLVRRATRAVQPLPPGPVTHCALMASGWARSGHACQQQEEQEDGSDRAVSWLQPPNPLVDCPAVNALPNAITLPPSLPPSPATPPHTR